MFGMGWGELIIICAIAAFVLMIVKLLFRR